MSRKITPVILNGQPAIVDETGRPVVQNIQVGIEYRGKKYNVIRTFAEGPWHIQGDAQQGVIAGANAQIEYKCEGEGIALRSSYTHKGENVPECSRFYTLWGLWRCGFERCLYNQPLTVNGITSNQMQAKVNTVRFVGGQTVTGTENMAFIDKEGSNALAGFISFENYFPSMEAGEDGRLRAWAQMESWSVTEGESLTGDWLYIGLCDDVRYGLIDYARIAARYMNSRGGKTETPWGFCDWYYYTGRISSKTVRDNLQTLAQNDHRLQPGYFNLDNGWFKEWGDWTANDKFACGMKAVADEIRAAGYLPGIWLVPFGVLGRCKLLEEHPDWFVRRRDNNEIYEIHDYWGGFFALDMSHPEVKQYTHDVFHRISYEWGYRHIKIDIVSNTLVPGKYYDPSFNSLKNYREGLRIIREAVTEDSIILDCTAPIGPSIGYVDGMRASEDIFENWDCLCALYNENLKRYYYNKIWFNNDPDCLLVRTADEEDDECGRPCTRTDAENRTFATAIMATGGAMIMSDKMPLLKEYQLELLSKMFPINTRAAIPLDLMESDTPGLLDLGRRGNTHIFALINWTEASGQMKLDIGCGHVFEFWAQQYLGYQQGECSFEVEPHGARILFVTDDAPIAAIGVDDCLCPTVQQRYENGVLTGSFIKKGESMFVLSAQPITKAEGCTCTCICAQTGLYKLTQTGEDLGFTVG